MYKHLTHHEVYYIWLNCVNNLIKMKATDVAKKINRHKSTVYRAIRYAIKNDWFPFQDKGPIRKRKKLNLINYRKK